MVVIWLLLQISRLKRFRVTLSYYSLPDVAGGEGGYALWGDVQIDAGIPVKFGLPGGRDISRRMGLDGGQTGIWRPKLQGQAGNY